MTTSAKMIPVDRPPIVVTSGSSVKDLLVGPGGLIRGANGGVSSFRALLSVVVLSHVGMTWVDVVWRLAVITTLGKTPIPAFPAFAHEVFLWLELILTSVVAGEKWLLAWGKAGGMRALREVFSKAKEKAVDVFGRPVDRDEKWGFDPPADDRDDEFPDVPAMEERQ